MRHAMLSLCLLIVALPVYAEDTLCIDKNFRSINALKYSKTRLGGSWEQLRTAIGKKPVTGEVYKINANDTGWLYLIVHNKDSFDRFLELFLHSITISEARIFVVENEKVDSSQFTGNLFPLHDRATHRRDMSLPLIIKAGQTVEVYVSIHRRGFPEIITFNLADVRYGDGTYWEESLAVFVAGFCLLIWLISFAFYFYFKALEYLFYFSYVSFGSLYLIAHNGFIPFFLPNAVWFYETAPIFFAAPCMAGFILFSRIVLNVKATNKIMYQILGLSPYIAILLISTGFAFSFQLLSADVYIATGVFAALFCISIFAYIFRLAFLRTFIKKEHIYFWFVVIFFNLFILVALALIMETYFVYVDRKWVVILRGIMIPSEISLSFVFLITRINNIIKKQQKNELDAQKKALDFAQQKEDQQRYYSNMLHNVIKGKINSAIVGLRHDNLVNEDLYELIRICELGDTFLKTENDDIYLLLYEIAFRAKRLLHSDIEERVFYSELDSSLKGILLSQSQKYELIFFIYEVVNNILKYSKYRHASITLTKNLFHSKNNIVLEIADDGVGLQKTLGIPEASVEIEEGNFEYFDKNYLMPYGHTGIRRLFEHSKKLSGQLIILSKNSNGTSIKLTFPNSG